MDLIEDVEAVKRLCNGILLCAVKDIKNKMVAEKNKKDAIAFLLSEWGSDIIEAAGYDMSGRDIIQAVKQSRMTKFYRSGDL